MFDSVDDLLLNFPNTNFEQFVGIKYSNDSFDLKNIKNSYLMDNFVLVKYT